MQHKKITVLIVLLLFLAGCSTSKKDAIDKKTDSVRLKEASRISDAARRTKLFFYNLYLPCDLSSLFMALDANYNPSLVNPVDNIDNYTSSLKKALNLGVYGVDLGYVRMYEQLQESKKYFYAINKLSDQMGIPNNYVDDAIDFFESNITNKDSLHKITCDVYEVTDQYLNENERECAAVLVILGGWVEALYITSNMTEERKPNKEIMKRIARQKYSLNSLINLLNLYQDHLIVTNYLVMMNSLKKEFDNVEIYFENMEDIEIDTINRIISTERSKVKMTPEQFISIKRKITTIRKSIVTY